MSEILIIIGYNSMKIFILLLTIDYVSDMQMRTKTNMLSIAQTILNIIRMMAEDNLNNLTNSFSFHGSVQSV